MTNEIHEDPLEFLTNLWGKMGFSLPGMVTPTVDTDEIGKRIADLKAVEGWLKSNLSLLQMSIQGLEMQRATLMAFQQMTQVPPDPAQEARPAPNPFLNPAAWTMPWDVMTGSAQTPAAAPPAEAAAPAAPAKPKRSPRKKSQPKG